MTRRRQIITAVTTGTLTQAQAARAYGVSPSMVSKLLRQWAREGTAAYYTKPSTPHGHPAATPPATIRAITALRTELTTQG
ncbi:helix-turn-helix domain-containing protein, partial [Kocuria palustris]